MGTLILDDESIAGALMPGSELLWRRNGSQTANPLTPDVEARLRFSEPRNRPDLSPLQQHQAQTEARRKAALRGAWSPGQDTPTSGDDREQEPAAAWTNAIHLRNGDLISGRMISIDPRGVRFQSDRYGIAVVPHDRVRALELTDASTLGPLDEPTKRRLLTIPRTQSDTPPTHLVVALTGDYLRGRLQDVNEQRLRMELHTAVVDIPREQVSQVIWLDTNDLSRSATQSEPTTPTKNEREPRNPGSRSPGQVQVRRADGERLTLAKAGFNGESITGRSDLFGDTRIPIGEINEIVSGPAIVSFVTGRGLGLWMPRPAPLPLVDSQADEDQTLFPTP